MASILGREAGVPAFRIGVSGSILVDLHTSRSDIDLILYGMQAARRCHSKLQMLLGARSQGFDPYEERDVRRLYVQRKQRTSMPFKAFFRHERLKVLQGKFKGTDYFIRCVRDWSEWQENYGDRKYYPAGRATVDATISDESESIFTPCTYRLAKVRGTEKSEEPTHIVSFRGRFCEQAHAGERVRARGTLERIVDEHGVEYRLIIGENPRDYLMVVGRRG
jgi:predicted nucleotidyltransferase